MDAIKATLIDEILHGKEIFITVSNHNVTNDFTNSMKIWVLYGGQPYRELFRWKFGGPSLGITSNPVTLKEALALVETYWNDRLEPDRFTYPVFMEPEHG